MTPQASLVNALRRVLRPLVRLLTAQGITFPMLAELLKQIYVDEAVRHFGLGGEPPSDSRVSLLTGVHRKDVKRLRQSRTDDSEAMPEMVALGAQLAAAWTTRKDLRDARGRPRPLPRLGTKAELFRTTRSCSSILTTPRRSHSSSRGRARMSLLMLATSPSKERAPPWLASRGSGRGRPRASRRSLRVVQAAASCAPSATISGIASLDSAAV